MPKNSRSQACERFPISKYNDSIVLCISFIGTPSSSMHLLRISSSGTTLSAEHESSASEVVGVFLCSAVSVAGSSSASEVGEVFLVSSPDVLFFQVPEDDEAAFSALSVAAHATSFALFWDLEFWFFPHQSRRP